MNDCSCLITVQHSKQTTMTNPYLFIGILIGLLKASNADYYVQRSIGEYECQGPCIPYKDYHYCYTSNSWEYCTPGPNKTVWVLIIIIKCMLKNDWPSAIDCTKLKSKHYMRLIYLITKFLSFTSFHALIFNNTALSDLFSSIEISSLFCS